MKQKKLSIAQNYFEDILQKIKAFIFPLVENVAKLIGKTIKRLIVVIEKLKKAVNILIHLKITIETLNKEYANLTAKIMKLNDEIVTKDNKNKEQEQKIKGDQYIIDNQAKKKKENYEHINIEGKKLEELKDEIAVQKIHLEFVKGCNKEEEKKLEITENSLKKFQEEIKTKKNEKKVIIDEIQNLKADKDKIILEHEKLKAEEEHAKKLISKIPELEKRESDLNASIKLLNTRFNNLKNDINAIIAKEKVLISTTKTFAEIKEKIMPKCREIIEATIKVKENLVLKNISLKDINEEIATLKERKNTYEKEIDSFEITKTELTLGNEDLKNENKLLKEENKDSKKLKEEYAKLKEKIENIKQFYNRYNELARKLQSLYKVDLTKCYNSKTYIKDILWALENKINASFVSIKDKIRITIEEKLGLEKEKENLTKDKFSLIAQNERLNEEFNRLKQRKDKAKKAFQEEKQKLNEENIQIWKEICEKKEDKLHLINEIASATNKKNELEKEIKDNEKKIENLETRYESKAKKIDEFIVSLKERICVIIKRYKEMTSFFTSSFVEMGKKAHDISSKIQNKLTKETEAFKLECLKKKEEEAKVIKDLVEEARKKVEEESSLLLKKIAECHVEWNANVLEMKSKEKKVTEDIQAKRNEEQEKHKQALEKMAKEEESISKKIKNSEVELEEKLKKDKEDLLEEIEQLIKKKEEQKNEIASKKDLFNSLVDQCNKSSLVSKKCVDDNIKFFKNQMLQNKKLAAKAANDHNKLNQITEKCKMLRKLPGSLKVDIDKLALLAKTECKKIHEELKQTKEKANSQKKAILNTIKEKFEIVFSGHLKNLEEKIKSNEAIYNGFAEKIEKLAALEQKRIKYLKMALAKKPEKVEPPQINVMPTAILQQALEKAKIKMEQKLLEKLKYISDKQNTALITISNFKALVENVKQCIKLPSKQIVKIKEVVKTVPGAIPKEVFDRVKEKIQDIYKKEQVFKKIIEMRNNALTTNMKNVVVLVEKAKNCIKLLPRQKMNEENPAQFKNSVSCYPSSTAYSS